MSSLVNVSELLKGDVSKVKMWLTSDDCKTNVKTSNLFLMASSRDRIDICEVIIESVQFDGEVVTRAMTVACCAGHLSLAQRIVRRYHASTQVMYHALCDGSRVGHTEVVHWLCE